MISEDGEMIDMPDIPKEELLPPPEITPPVTTAEKEPTTVSPPPVADKSTTKTTRVPRPLWNDHWNDKENNTMEAKKRIPWGWIIFAVIIVAGIFLINPVQKLITSVNNQSELESKVEKLESDSAALAQQNQALVQKNQELTAAVEKQTALESKVEKLEDNTAALTQQNQTLAQKNQELVAAVEQKTRIVNIIDQTNQKPTITQTTITAPTSIEPFAQVFGNEGINILKKLDSKEYGYRWTASAREYLYPAKTDPWQDLTKTELNQVQNTWFLISFTVPKGFEATVFSHGFNTLGDIPNSKYGYLVMFEEGNYQISIRDWEIVFRPVTDIEYRSKDLNRIFTEIKNGNLDIHQDLALAVVSNNLMDMIPFEKLVNQVQFVDYKQMTVK
ncbi:MAG: hypothetical protein PHX84_00430 [Candidatus Shapirobacteria bacterium]|nr:hypothetical protein [Candidatus Shapirobacteria bacterium]